MEVSEEEDVVFGYKNFCQTINTKWLCLEDIYQKFHRPNAYDVGGTYNQDILDHRFIYMTKEVGGIFLLELFIVSHLEETSSITISSSNELTLDKNFNKAYLDKCLKDYHIQRDSDKAAVYLRTYSFSDLDVELLKDKKLYIAISFQNSPQTHINTRTLDYVKVHHDFGDLLIDPIGADFVIESSEGEKFHAHKVLLSAQSEVFKAMLKQGTAESQNGYVKLIDASKEDVQCILEFIYTGTLKNLENCNCYNLIMIADRYNLNGLKELAQHALYFQLAYDNAVEILVLADMYNASMLKKAALKFIKKYKCSLDNNLFREIKNVELVKELCLYLAMET